MGHAGPHALALAWHPGTDNICPGPAFSQNKPLIKQLVLVLAHGLSPSLFNEKRHLLPNLQKLGKPVVVINQAGAGGAIATELAAHAPADGYTLEIGYVATHATNPAVKKVPYDPVKDFTPIGMIGGTPNLLIVRSSLPVKTVKEFVAYARAAAE